MNVFFTSDHHFGHKAVIQYCQRPFSSEVEMDEIMISNWRAMVQPDDIVYYLGDFSFSRPARTKEIFEMLPGRKILVQGNHDHTATKQCFRPLIYQELKLILNGERVTLSHYPYQGDHTPEDRYQERRPHDQGEWLIHGHVHNAWRVRNKMISVSVENWNYKPVSLSEIQRIMNGGPRPWP